MALTARNHLGDRANLESVISRTNVTGYESRIALLHISQTSHDFYSASYDGVGGTSRRETKGAKDIQTTPRVETRAPNTRVGRMPR